MQNEDNLKRIADSLEEIVQILSTYYSSPAYLEPEVIESNLKLEKPEKETVTSHIETNNSKNDPDKIISYLDKHNVQIKTLREEEPKDIILEQLSDFLGSRYNNLSDFLARVKSSLNPNKSFNMNLANNSQEEISDICQFANDLHRMAFLAEYRYFNSPKYTLIARPNNNAQAIMFFTGQWLEYFVKNEIEESIKELMPKANYNFLTNPQIILPNGDDSELDIIYEVEGKIFWFEAKTGNYQNYIQKYSNIKNLLKLNKENSFLVITDLSDSYCHSLSNLYEINVVNLDLLKSTFKESLDSVFELSNE